MTTRTLQNSDSLAMVEQIRAEAPHLPAATIDAWHRAGPLRVEREIIRRPRQLPDGGLLRIGDPSRAAVHFSALVTAGLTTYYATVPRRSTRSKPASTRCSTATPRPP